MDGCGSNMAADYLQNQENDTIFVAFLSNRVRYV
jgi:hypothetical protein